MRRQEAIELVEESHRCPRCRWLAAGYILNGKWKRVDDSTVSKADKIRWKPEPKRHS